MHHSVLRARGLAASLWGMVLLALVLRLVVVVLTTGAAYDITSYHIQAYSVLAHQNVYSVTDRYPYPPVWIWLVALGQIFANLTGFPFAWLVKVPSVMGDCITVCLLRRRKSVAAGLFYALNPISILITAGHGQFDGLVLALVIAAWALWTPYQPKGLFWAALALGGAIALKGYPVLLLPALLIKAPSNRLRATLAMLALAPMVAAMLIYSALFGLDAQMISHILSYSGAHYFGWGPYVFVLLSNLWTAGSYAVAPLLSLVARALIPIFTLLYSWKYRSRPLEEIWLVAFLLVYAFAPGLAPQYLLWALPLLALVNLKQGFHYTALAFPALVFFYLALQPGAVPGGPQLAVYLADKQLGYYLVINFAWWLYCLWLLIAAVRGGGRARNWKTFVQWEHSASVTPSAMDPIKGAEVLREHDQARIIACSYGTDIPAQDYLIASCGLQAPGKSSLGGGRARLIRNAPYPGKPAAA